MPSERDRTTSLILPRFWPDVVQLWFDSVVPHEKPGIPPDTLPSDIMDFVRHMERLSVTDCLRIPSEEIIGLRQAVFSESVYSLHRAAHVVGAANEHIRVGMHHWSASSSYQAAFFAARAALGFFGVYPIEYNKQKSALVDLWSKPRKVKKNTKNGDCILIRSMKSIGHGAIWSFLNRCLEVTDDMSQCMPIQWSTRLKSCDFEEFMEKRHELHYRVNGWPRGTCYPSDIQLGVLQLEEALNPEASNYMLSVAVHLLRFGCYQLRDISRSSPALRQEIGLIEKWFSGDRGIAYRSLQPAGNRS